jgi:hypothetical protein
VRVDGTLPIAARPFLDSINSLLETAKLNSVDALAGPTDVLTKRQAAASLRIDVSMHSCPGTMPQSPPLAAWRGCGCRSEELDVHADGTVASLHPFPRSWRNTRYPGHFAGLRRPRSWVEMLREGDC